MIVLVYHHLPRVGSQFVVRLPLIATVSTLKYKLAQLTSVAPTRQKLIASSAFFRAREVASSTSVIRSQPASVSRSTLTSSTPSTIAAASATLLSTSIFPDPATHFSLLSNVVGKPIVNSPLPVASQLTRMLQNDSLYLGQDCLLPAGARVRIMLIGTVESVISQLDALEANAASHHTHIINDLDDADIDTDIDVDYSGTIRTYQQKQLSAGNASVEAKAGEGAVVTSVAAGVGLASVAAYRAEIDRVTSSLRVNFIAPRRPSVKKLFVNSACTALRYASSGFALD